MKTISEFSKCFAFAVREVQGKLPVDAKEIKTAITKEFV